MDFNMVPWGQGFYITDNCGPTRDPSVPYTWGHFFQNYDASHRMCFDIMCGAEAESFYGTRPDDCFTSGPNTGPFCQHGGAECAVNSVQACAKQLSNNDFSKYGPFVVCLEENYEYIRVPPTSDASTTYAENRVLAEPVINSTVKDCLRNQTQINAEEVLSCFYSSENDQLASM